jgi:hypothetical protein
MSGANISSRIGGDLLAREQIGVPVKIRPRSANHLPVSSSGGVCRVC